MLLGGKRTHLLFGQQKRVIKAGLDSLRDVK
jgi:hypothetical protein